jgi:hypothetical protein
MAAAIYILVGLLLILLAMSHIGSDTSSATRTAPVVTLKEITLALRSLEGHCLDTSHNPEWWVYIWCFRRSIVQVHLRVDDTDTEIVNIIGNFSIQDSRPNKQVYKGMTADCRTDDGKLKKRRGEVEIRCCPDNFFAEHDKLNKPVDSKVQSFISSIEEKEQCHYSIVVCSKLMCELEPPTAADHKQHSKPVHPHSHSANNPSNTYVTRIADIPVHNRLERNTGGTVMSLEEQSTVLKRVKAVFKHGYQAYLENAYPKVVAPLSLAPV